MKRPFHAFTTIVMASVFLTFPQIPMNAQKSRHLEYAFGHSIETSAGCSWFMDGTIPATGGDFNFRYTYFWGKHFGVFGEFGLSGHTRKIADIFNTLDPSFDYEPMRIGSKSPMTTVSHFTLGLAYRLDHGIWSFRPRIGLGYGGHDRATYSYYRFSKSSPSETPEKVSIGNATINGRHTNSEIGSLAVSAGLQVICSVCAHFFLFAEIDGLLMASSFYVTEDIYSTQKLEYSNWIQAVIGSFGEQYNATHWISSTSSRRRSGGTVGLNIGIGWNIGHNRNTGGKYGRR